MVCFISAMCSPSPSVNKKAMFFFMEVLHIANSNIFRERVLDIISCGYKLGIITHCLLYILQRSGTVAAMELQSVVTQPVVRTTTTAVVRTKANDYLFFNLALIFTCCVCGCNTGGIICLLPALICAALVRCSPGFCFK